EIEIGTEIFLRHRRALDVPAGAALAPRRIPRRLAGLGRLPQREVERRALLLAHVDARAGLELIERLMRELAVGGEIADREVDVALRRVGDPARHQLLDQRDDLAHVVGDLGLDVGRDAAERGGVFAEDLREAFCQREEIFAELVGALDDLVVDVGDVADVGDLEPALAQMARDHVEGDHRARVAEVDEVVGGRAAGVHAHAAGLTRNQLDLLALEGVVNSNHWRRRRRYHTLKATNASSRRQIAGAHQNAPGCSPSVSTHASFAIRIGSSTEAARTSANGSFASGSTSVSPSTASLPSGAEKRCECAW